MRRELWWRSWRGVGWWLLLWSRIIEGCIHAADDNRTQANSLGSSTRIDKVDKGTAVGELYRLNFTNVVQRINKVGVGFEVAADPNKGSAIVRCNGVT